MRRLACLPLAAGALALVGCTDELAPLEGTTSLKVELVAPADPGSDEHPLDYELDPATHEVTVKVTALDTQGEVDTAFTKDVDVYVQFLGSLTPELESRATLGHVHLEAGASTPTAIDLPPVFGPTFLWIEDGTGDDATYATGTSPSLRFRDPYIANVSTPKDESRLDALSASPLQGKQIVVHASRHGARGRLVVTSVFAQGYTVSDVQCADDAGTPPCTTAAYDHVLIFTFSRPRGAHGPLQVGETIERFTGAVSEFNGLTEISFPQTFASDAAPEPARIPPPVVVQESWLSTDMIEFERNEAFQVAVENAKLCPLDSNYTDYKQWKLDIGSGCGAAINVITSGVVDFEPGQHVGSTVTRVVGTLRPVSIGSFNVWIIYPRSASDLTLQ